MLLLVTCITKIDFVLLKHICAVCLFLCFLCQNLTQQARLAMLKNQPWVNVLEIFQMIELFMFIAFICLFLLLIIYVNFFFCVAKFWLLPELNVSLIMCCFRLQSRG